MWQYFCESCGYTRPGALDIPHGIGGYSWACPECGSHRINSRPAENKMTPTIDHVREMKNIMALVHRTVPNHLYVGKNVHDKLVAEMTPDAIEGVTMRTVLGLEVHTSQNMAPDMMFVTAAPLA